MDAEEALSALGKWSRWQMCMFLLAGFGSFFLTSMQTLSIVFIGFEPEHRCALSPDSYLNESIPHEVVNGRIKYSKCEKYSLNSSNIYGNVTTDCEGKWYYDPEPGQTIITEWNLICKWNYMAELSQTIMLGGIATGAIFCSYLSDRFGRKAVGVPAVILMSILGGCSAFTQSYLSFVAMKFFTGIAQQIAVLSLFVHGCEIFPAKQRTAPGILMQNFWPGGMMALAIMAYFIRNWRHLQLAISIPGIVIFVYYWILSESIPWLVARGRHVAAKQILQKAAKFNNIPVPTTFQISGDDREAMLTANDDENSYKNDERNPELSKSCDRSRDRFMNLFTRDVSTYSDTSQKNATIFDVLKSSKLRMNTAIMCCVWFFGTLIYFAMSLSTSALAGDPYLNSFLSGLVEIPAYFMAAFLLRVWGRRYSICMFFTIGGILLFISAFVPETIGNRNVKALPVTLVMTAKFAISGSFSSIFLYAPEIFPTTARNAGMGLASLSGRIGFLLSPFGAYVGKIIPWVPGVVFGVAAAISGLLVLLLPETLGRRLPESVVEIENWTRALSKEEKDALRLTRKKPKKDSQSNGTEMDEMK